MAKRQRKTKTEAEMAEIEADRIAAAEGTGPYADKTEQLAEIEADRIAAEIGRTLEEDHADEELTDKEEERLEEQEAFEEAIALNESEDADDEKVPNSIVKDKFKVKYAENAAAIGDTRKQVKRSNWDWLAQQLAAACLSDKGKIEIGSFTDILDANGVDHSRWTNKNKGWEGRFRMTGRVALQKVVANAGSLKLPGGDALEAPADFIARYKTKS